MLANTSTCNKTLGSDTADEGKELIEALYSVLSQCPVCVDKIKKLKIKAGVNQTPDQTNRQATIQQPRDQSRKPYHNV